MTITPQSLTPLQALPGWIYLQRDGNKVGRSVALMTPFRFPGSSSARSYAGLMSARVLSRPSTPQGDYRAIRTFALSEALEADVDFLAGGSIDELRISGQAMLNTHRGWTRGWQTGLEFSRNGVLCYARTGGSVYSGERTTHPDWTTAPAPPGATIGTLKSTLAAYADHERQGAWCQTAGMEGTTFRSVTLPIELDPDGFCGGDDHGVIEAGDSTDPAPEQLLPVLYHGLRISTTIRLATELAPEGIHEVKVTILTPGKSELAVDGPWVFDAARFHLRGDAARTLLRANGTTIDLTTELIPGGAGATYSDLGFDYELERQVVRRNEVPFVTPLADWWAGCLCKEACGRFIGIHLDDAGIKDIEGTILPASRVWGYADRTDLSGDPRDGDRHHFMSGHWHMAESVIRNGTVATYHLITADTLEDFEDLVDLIPERPAPPPPPPPNPPEPYP